MTAPDTAPRRPTIATIGHRFADAVIESAAAAPFGVDVACHGGLPKVEALRAAAGADGVLLGLGFALDASALAQLERCRVIVRYGIGLDNVDVEAAATRGIRVFNVPDYGIEEVANHTLALLLAIARRLDVLAERARAGRWTDALAGLELRRLSCATLLVVGAGRIGRAVVERAAPIFGTVLVHDPFAAQADWSDGRIAWEGDLEAALRRADFVTLHVPSSDATRHLLSETRLESLKVGSVLVNCSRGDVVDEAALRRLLERGHIAAAGLDVFASEPHPDPYLMASPRVWPTPHVAWFSREAVVDLREKAARTAAEAIVAPRALSPLGRASGGGGRP